MAMTQGIYEISGTKNYPIGMRYAIDERAFRYARIGFLQAVIGRAVANFSTGEELAVAAANSALGARTVTITVQAAAGLEENELQGGYVCYCWYYRHRIKSHPAALSGATCVITLETPIFGTEVVSGVTWLSVYHNMWHSVGFPVGATDSYCSFVGFPYNTIAVGQYTWIQTWGPISGVTGDWWGATVHERQVWFAGNGGLDIHHPGDHVFAKQHCGFLIPCTAWGGALHDLHDGGHLIYLQIAP